jgi:hypothetical protein
MPSARERLEYWRKLPVPGTPLDAFEEAITLLEEFPNGWIAVAPSSAMAEWLERRHKLLEGGDDSRDLRGAEGRED